MKRRLISLTIAAVLALSCQSSDEAYAAPETQELSRLYGDYLAGSYANKIKDRAAQQKYFADAYHRQPSDIQIGRKAIIAAIEMGDMPAAVKLSERVRKANRSEPLARAILGVDAFRRGREGLSLIHI